MNLQRILGFLFLTHALYLFRFTNSGFYYVSPLLSLSVAIVLLMTKLNNKPALSYAAARSVFGLLSGLLIYRLGGSHIFERGMIPSFMAWLLFLVTIFFSYNSSRSWSSKKEPLKLTSIIKSASKVATLTAFIITLGFIIGIILITKHGGFLND